MKTLYYVHYLFILLKTILLLLLIYLDFVLKDCPIQWSLIKMTNPASVPWPVPPHAPSCHVPEIAMSGSVVELHCEYKQTVPPVTYSWYKDNRPLSTAHVPDINYSIDNKTGTLVLSEIQQERFNVCGIKVQLCFAIWMHPHKHKLISSSHDTQLFSLHLYLFLTFILWWLDL